MKFALAAAAALMSTGALAQQAPQPPAAAAAPAPAEERVNQLIIYGDDPCPRGADDEIVVCARLPEDERYRISPNLRSNPNDPAGQSWAANATELSYVGRTGIGSCSPVGGGGVMGCREQLVRAARAERAGREEVNWSRLIDQARQERLGRIDAEAAEVERQLDENE